MTIKQAIRWANDMFPNNYTDKEKIFWLSKLDEMVYRDVICTHEGADEIEFEPYDDNTDRDTELLIYSPYDEMYTFWLESKIDYHNAEYDRYNNAVVKWNELYGAFKDDYNRTHMPVQTRYRYY